MHHASALSLTAHVAVLAYGSIYSRNTLKPIQRIIDSSDEASLKDEMKQWTSSKLKEAQYVQVAVSSKAGQEICGSILTSQ